VGFSLFVGLGGFGESLVGLNWFVGFGVGLGGFGESLVGLDEVVGFGGNDVPHPSPGVRHVPFESGDDVHVQVEDRLARRLAYVDSDVVAVRRAVLFFYGVFGDVDRFDEGLLLFGCGFEPGGDEAGWD